MCFGNIVNLISMPIKQIELNYDIEGEREKEWVMENGWIVCERERAY